MKSLMFICAGNICRSPLAEALFEDLCQHRGIDTFEIDSSGIYAFHEGQRADVRTRQNAEIHGIQISHRSKPLKDEDLKHFDLLITLDESIHQAVLQRAQESLVNANKVQLLRTWDPQRSDWDVPDPYYNGEQGFEEVFQIIKRCLPGLLDFLLSSS